MQIFEPEQFDEYFSVLFGEEAYPEGLPRNVHKHFGMSQEDFAAKSGRELFEVEDPENGGKVSHRWLEPGRVEGLEDAPKEFADRSHLRRVQITRKNGVKAWQWIDPGKVQPGAKAHPEQTDHPENAAIHKPRSADVPEGQEHPSHAANVEARQIIANPEKITSDHLKRLGHHLEAMTPEQLKALAKDLGEKIGGSKGALATRLYESVRDNPEVNPSKGPGSGLREIDERANTGVKAEKNPRPWESLGQPKKPLPGWEDRVKEALHAGDQKTASRVMRHESGLVEPELSERAKKIGQAVKAEREEATKPPEAPTSPPVAEPAPKAPEATPEPTPADAAPKPPEPGFTGIDAHGHQWRDGVQVARGEEEPAKPEATPDVPTPTQGQRITDAVRAGSTDPNSRAGVVDALKKASRADLEDAAKQLKLSTWKGDSKKAIAERIQAMHDTLAKARSSREGIEGKPEREGAGNPAITGTDTPQFSRWFEGSKVADDKGKPIVVYHGTDKHFEDFDPAKIGNNFGKKLQDQGFWFTQSKDQALEYASNLDGTKAGKHTIDVYLSMKNPAIWGDTPENRPLKGGFVKKAMEEGKDGVIFHNIEDGTGITSTQYLVFKPDQIKTTKRVAEEAAKPQPAEEPAGQATGHPILDKLQADAATATPRVREAIEAAIHNATNAEGKFAPTGEREGEQAGKELIARRLVSEWNALHDAGADDAELKPLTDAMTANGMSPIGKRGERVPFDPALHETAGTQFGNHEIERPGWTLPREGGGKYLASRAKTAPEKQSSHNPSTGVDKPTSEVTIPPSAQTPAPGEGKTEGGKMETTTLPELKGSEKQVAFAGDVRAKLLSKLDQFTPEELNYNGHDYGKELQAIKQEVAKNRHLAHASFWADRSRRTTEEMIHDIENAALTDNEDHPGFEDAAKHFGHLIWKKLQEGKK